MASDFRNCANLLPIGGIRRYRVNLSGLGQAPLASRSLSQAYQVPNILLPKRSWLFDSLGKPRTACPISGYHRRSGRRPGSTWQDRERSAVPLLAYPLWEIYVFGCSHRRINDDFVKFWWHDVQPLDCWLEGLTDHYRERRRSNKSFVVDWHFTPSVLGRGRCRVQSPWRCRSRSSRAFGGAR